MYTLGLVDKKGWPVMGTYINHYGQIDFVIDNKVPSQILFDRIGDAMKKAIKIMNEPICSEKYLVKVYEINI